MGTKGFIGVAGRDRGNEEFLVKAYKFQLDRKSKFWAVMHSRVALVDNDALYISKELRVDFKYVTTKMSSEWDNS